MKELLPTVVVGREGADASDLVWSESRGEQWFEARFDFDVPDSIAEHALVLSRLVPDGSAIVLTNDQGDVYDLRLLSGREALLAAVEGDAAG